MWKMSSDRRTGEYHENKKMKCQDQVYYRERNRRQVIVLADGTGVSDINAACVSEVVKYTAEKLLTLSEAGNLRRLSRYELTRELMGGIIEIISGYMDRSHLPADCFGSTLLAFIVNMETGSYLLLHLGDGIIIGKEKRHVRVLSWPVSCGSDRTFLTISENLPERIKIRCGNIGDLDQIVLCSDGMYEYPLSKEFTENRIWEILEGGKIYLQREDDQSFIQLKKVSTAK